MEILAVHPAGISIIVYHLPKRTCICQSESPLIVYKLLSKAIRGKLANQFGSGDCEYF
jgi:hypothetical protein